MSEARDSIRGVEIQLGDICFLWQPASLDFRVGNIEEVLIDSVRVSFAAATWARRDEAQMFSVDSIIFAPEMSPNVSESGRTFQAHEVLVRMTSTDVCNAYGVMANQEHTNHPILACRLALDQSNQWTPCAQPEVLELDQLYRPDMLSLISRRIFCSPVHPLFDVLIQRAGVGLEYSGPAILQLDDIGVPVQAHVKVDGHIIEVVVAAHFSVASSLLGVRRRFAREELSPMPQSATPWTLSVVWNGGSQHAEAGGIFTGTITVLPLSFVIKHSTGTVIATTEVYVGAPIELWTDLIWYREQPLNLFLMMLNHGPISNGTFFDCFGRNGIIHRPISYSEGDKSYLAVTYLGEPLDRTEASILTTLIGYISGGRAVNVATETSSLEEKLRTVIHDRGQATMRKRPPLPVNQPHLNAAAVLGSLSTMLKEFARWHQIDRNSFDAIFHHYAEGVDSNYPVTRTLRLIIAFEAFVNLVTQNFAENEKIIDDDAFDIFCRSLIENSKKFHVSNSSQLGQEALARFINKLTNLNLGSNTRRIKRFWELIDIEVSDEDQRLLRRLRNDSVHKGFLIATSGEHDLLGTATDAARLCDLLNRAILYHAKYRGPILSAVDFTLLDPKSGTTYYLDEVRESSKVTIQHDASPSAMTMEEKAAADSLFAMQSTSDKSR